MKKQSLLLFLILLSIIGVQAQDLKIFLTDKTNPKDKDFKEVTTHNNTLLRANTPYIIRLNKNGYRLSANEDTDEKNWKNFNDEGLFNLGTTTFGELKVKSIEILDEKTNKVFVFLIENATAGAGAAGDGAAVDGAAVDADGGDEVDVCKLPLLDQYKNFIFTKYGEIFPTNYGLLLDKIDDMPYGGPEFIHLFYDQYGNSLLSTPPTGVPTMQYVVHVVYKRRNDNDKEQYLSLKQTKGSFNDALSLENTRPKTSETDAQLQSTADCEIVENVLLLSTSTSDMEFAIYSMAFGKKPVKLTIQKIKMSSIYHGTIGVGLHYSQLSNASYSLVADPFNAQQTVVKESGAEGGRALLNIMATYYWSPFTTIAYALQRGKLKRGASLGELKNPVAKFQTYSKSNLYMRPVWERFYPTVGVCMNDQSFQNLLFGVNWEFARGGSLFLGGHMAKVNTFSAPTVDGNNVALDNNNKFEYGKTFVNQAQFDIGTDTRFKVGFSVGLSIDFTIFSNFFPKF